MNTRVIGIDLAVTGTHKAIVLDQASNTFVSKVIAFDTDPAKLDRLLDMARAGAPHDICIRAVLEATALAWFTVGIYLHRHGVEVHRVSGQQVGELRKIYQRRAKSDRIDARVLARLPLLYPERLHRCHFPSGREMALQRACREVFRLTKQAAASKNRLRSVDRFAWPGASDILAPYSEEAFWFRANFYDPWQVLQEGEEGLTASWYSTAVHPPADAAWIPALVQRAKQVVALYGDPDCIDYAQLQASLQREQERLRHTAEQARQLRTQVVRPLYRELHPQRHLETIQGVGQDSAAVYIAFVGDILRFPALRQFRAWSGMTPFGSQSGETEAHGLRITKAGPDLIKATAFRNAHIARMWDPQIAAVYYQQIMSHGKHHLQAICACATHLLDRIYTVLREDRPYQLRDVDGTPLTKQQARIICQQRYHVPDEARIQNNKRARQARREQRLEKRQHYL